MVNLIGMSRRGKSRQKCILYLSTYVNVSSRYLWCGYALKAKDHDRSRSAREIRGNCTLRYITPFDSPDLEMFWKYKISIKKDPTHVARNSRPTFRFIIVIYRTMPDSRPATEVREGLNSPDSIYMSSSSFQKETKYKQSKGTTAWTVCVCISPDTLFRSDGSPRVRRRIERLFQTECCAILSTTRETLKGASSRTLHINSIDLLCVLLRSVTCCCCQ